MTSILRHRTAILRRKFSKPVQLLLDDGILTKESDFFDYGCGRGEDVHFLKKLEYKASGWDPHFQPHASIRPSSIVNLGYVLNVIESVEERIATLKRALEAAEDLLCVSVIASATSVPADAKPFGDGLLTSWNTFQKIFSQNELKQFIFEHTGHDCVLASVGIAYVFVTDKYKDAFLKSRIQNSKAAVSQELREAENARLVSEWIEKYHELGRPPLRAEFPEYGRMLRIFGSEEALLEGTRAELSEETIHERRDRRKSDLLINICRAMIRNNGPARPQDLDIQNRTDVRVFYGSFEEALKQAQGQLKSLSDLSVISQTMNASRVGKLLPDDLYIHVDSLAFLPDMLQIHIELAKLILPKDVPYNLIKIARNSWHVTFLNYPDFHKDAHPALHGSMKVLLHKNKLLYRDFSESENPPILHRKELFLHPEHPRFEMYSALSAAEEEAGLLGRHDIGHKKSWEALLAASGLRIAGHTLKKLKRSG